MQNEQLNRQNPTAEDYRASYSAVLIEFMPFFKEVRYPKDSFFPTAMLLEITPLDILRWMKLKVYGTPNPMAQDRPTKGRSTSLEFYKKALSAFMPNKLHPWSMVSLTGNPTRSEEINYFIAKIKKLEVKKIGKKSAARRPLVGDELLQTLCWLKTEGERTKDYKRLLMLPAAVKFQVAMIGRVDDACHMEKEELKPHPTFEFALTARINWSKNVLEERASPNQILLASKDWRTCVFLSMATYLEACFERGLCLQHGYLFGAANNSDSNIAFYGRTLATCWNHRDFQSRQSGPLGTHSIRKYAATRARESGATKDDTDGRARWKIKRVSDKYVTPLLGYPDAKVCGLLCVNGPIMYCLRNNSGISNEWLRNNVVPHIVQAGVIDNHVTIRLSLALLWGAMDDEVDFVPYELKARIRAAYSQLVANRDVDITFDNPVQKKALFIHGSEAELHITPLQEVDGPNMENPVAHAGNDASLSNEQFNLLYSCVERLSRNLDQLEQQFQHLHRVEHALLTRVSHNIIRLASQPVIARPRQDVVNAGDYLALAANPSPRAKLSKTPKTLHNLWTEWTTGIGGNKAAKDFTPAERGKVRQEYSRRKVAWEKISQLVNAHHTADRAIELIYLVYGNNRTLTDILKRMQQDRKNKVSHALLTF
jgi:Transcriptional activator of glycolytic enzymes